MAEAVNDMLKVISASVLMEQVLASRYKFALKDTGLKDGVDYARMDTSMAAKTSA